MRHHIALSLVIVSVAFLSGCGDKQTEIEQPTVTKTNSTPAVKSVLLVAKSVPSKVAKKEPVKKAAAETTRKSSLAFQRGYWLHHLQNAKSLAARVHAARRLYPLVDNVEPAVSELIKVLGTKGLKKEVTLDALKVITLYGVEAKPAVPVLIQQLSNPNPKIRIHTVLAIQSLGPEAKMAVPKLIERLDDMDTMSVQFYTAPELTLVNGKSQPVRVYALKALAEIGMEAKLVIPKLIKAIRKDNFAFVAVESLIKISPKEGEQFLLELLSDKDPGNDYAAFYGLSEIRTPKTYAMITKAIETFHSDHSGDAFELLLQFGPQALPHIVLGLKYPHEHTWAFSCGVGTTPIRTVATETLAKMGQKGYEALLMALNSQDQELRARAAECLIQIGPYEDRVLPVLIDILKNMKDLMTPDYSEEEHRGEKFIIVVKTTTVKSVALKTLMKMGANAKPAVSAIRPLLKQEQLKLLAASTLDAIVPGDVEAVKVLVPELDLLCQKLTNDKQIGTSEEDYIARFTKIGTQVVPVLTQMLDGDDKARQIIAIRALGHLAKRSKKARR